MKNIPKDILNRLEFKTSKKEPALGPVLRKVNPIEKPCDDCGKIVLDRRVRLSVNRSKLTKPHVKHHCQACKLYKNPTTGKFDMTFQEINRHFYPSVKKKR
jgi:hypothetical protein